MQRSTALVHQQLRAVLVKQTVFQNLQLQYADNADDVAFKTYALLTEYLNSTLLRQLDDALFKLLAFEGILRLYAGKNFRREYGEVFKLQLQAAVAQGITDTEDTRIKNADNVTWICFSTIVRS